MATKIFIKDDINKYGPDVTSNPDITFIDDFSIISSTDYNIVDVQVGKYSYKECDNIFTFDIEASSGYRQPDGRTIGYSHELNRQHPEYYNNADDEVQKAYGTVTYASLQYIWQFNIEDAYGTHFTVMGRTWPDFDDFLNTLTTKIFDDAQPNKSRKRKKVVRPTMHIYIHNESYEYNFLRNLYDDDFKKIHKTRSKKQAIMQTVPKARANVFARERNKPLKSTIGMNGCVINIHDTLCLTNRSLKNWGRDEKLKVQKLDEPEDFYLPVRTPKTPLTLNEIMYSNNDVEVMYYGLCKYRDRYIHLKHIPMTQTGEVRIDLRANVAEKNIEWVNSCRNVYASFTLDEYTEIMQLFSGGWTHANAFNTCSNFGSFKNGLVQCLDFRSSYPAVMTQFTFPVTPFEIGTIQDKNDIDATDPVRRKRRYYFKAKFTGLMSTMNNNYFSASKAIDIGDCWMDNGKVVKADYITVLLTDLDWISFNACYEWNDMEIEFVKVAEADYLCAELVATILDYYGGKTSLKGVAGAESMYAIKKQFVNAVYGDTVFKDVSDSVQYVGDYITEDDFNYYVLHGVLSHADGVYDEDGNFDPAETAKSISSGWITHHINETDFDNIMENMMENEKLYKQPLIGVWTTSAARYNLWTAIIKLDERVIYCDTDSIKGVFTDEDMKWIDEYNKSVKARYTDVVAYFAKTRPDMNITVEDYEPKTPKGTVKELGFFDLEDPCMFRTMGAKRYVDIIKNSDGEYELHATIAGISKHKAEVKFAKLSGVPYHLNKKNTVILDTTSEDELNKVLSAMQDGVHWEPDESGKLTAHYVHQTLPCIWIDRDGHYYTSTEYDEYGVCLQPAPYYLGLPESFRQLFKVLAKIQTTEWSTICPLLRDDENQRKILADYLEKNPMPKS